MKEYIQPRPGYDILAPLCLKVKKKRDIGKVVIATANPVVYTVVSDPSGLKKQRTAQFVRGTFLTHLVMRSKAASG